MYTCYPVLYTCLLVYRVHKVHRVRVLPTSSVYAPANIRLQNLKTDSIFQRMKTFPQCFVCLTDDHKSSFVGFSHQGFYLGDLRSGDNAIQHRAIFAGVASLTGQHGHAPPQAVQNFLFNGFRFGGDDECRAHHVGTLTDSLGGNSTDVQPRLTAVARSLASSSAISGFSLTRFFVSPISLG